MLILNLADKSKSTIDYEVLSFSDGQVLVNLLGRHGEGHTFTESTAHIYSRMGWGDLQLIIAANQALKLQGFKFVHLYVPYFLGARSDRLFKQGGVNYLRDVICPIITGQGFASVSVLDPHSNCLEMGLKNLKRIPADYLYQFAALTVYGKSTLAGQNAVLVGPDKGSYDRTVHAAHILDAQDVLMCDKHRDPATGKILSIDVGNLMDLEGADVFVIDDICDGGGTFIPLAKKLDNYNPGRKYLVTPHGIFSRGFEDLSLYYDGIFTTNSFKASYPSRQQRPDKDQGDEMFIKVFNVF